MNKADRLRAARKAAGFDIIADAIRRFGWSDVSYYQHENGGRGFRADTAEKYARAYRVNLEWLLTGRGDSKGTKVPVVGIVGAGSEIYPIDGIGELDRIDAPPGIGPTAVALIVRGDSQYPVLRDGDRVFYEEQTAPENLVGKEAIVSLADGRRMIKIIRRSNSEYSLESWNAPTIESAEIEWAARVRWIERA